MNRGDRRELIFMADADRQRFGETLGEETGSGNGNGVREQFPNLDAWPDLMRAGG